MTRIAATVIAALVCAGAANAAEGISLPSPVAPLSAEPPLAGGARASSENVFHSVSAKTDVAVAIDEAGTPFAVTATQRLDVSQTGDYFFTVGAPALSVRAPASSASVPGMRAGSILWAGFNPGDRRLVARVTLEPAKAVPSLPLRIRVQGKTVVLENATRLRVRAFRADAPRAPLVAYLLRLRSEVARGRPPLQTSVPLSSSPSPDEITVAAPLHVTGTIGERSVDLVLTGRTELHGGGRIALRVEPLERVGPISATSGRALLRAAIRVTLTLARAYQYDEFLGNPDPAGRSRTTYSFRTASPPHAAPIAAVGHHRRTWLETLLLVAVLAGTLLAGLAVWARS